MEDTEFFSWREAAGDDLTMLKDLQANILKGHVRDCLDILFLKFKDPEDAKALLHELAELMKSAWVHLNEVETFKQGGKPGSPYVGLGLSRKGYDALGVEGNRRPKDEAFKAGMQARATLKDDLDQWEPDYRKDIHAVVLVGDANCGPQKVRFKKVKKLIAAHPGVAVVLCQTGLGRHNANGDGIEHFGYVDGRSQPLFLREDILEERFAQDGVGAWDPRFPLDRVIVSDVGAPDPKTAFGSYFVFRKLEQDVRAFKKGESQLAEDLGLKGDDRERAGAMIIGRFEDGTPVAMQKSDGAHNPVPNNFNYDSDGEGGKCPFFGHIRKLNPRGSGKVGMPEDERKHIMARRGQTYGDRSDDPNDGETENKPTGDVGLLFMAFNVDIKEQFEFAQASWANNEAFPGVPNGAAAPGVDLVIGQLPASQERSDIEAPPAWSARRTSAGDGYVAAPAVPQTVTMRGGEYFFMPSLSFLRTV